MLVLAKRIAAALVALLAVGCNKPAPPSGGERVAEPAPSRVSAQPKSPSSDARLPVPETVAKVHRHAFAPQAANQKLGPVICVVTLHDAPLKRGSFYPLVLFERGGVATWRQTATGREEPFTATLGSDELARAVALLEAIGQGKTKARERFEPSAVVMGVSLREGETLYFDHGEIPEALSRLVGMLKGRLEATNRPPAAAD